MGDREHTATSASTRRGPRPGGMSRRRFIGRSAGVALGVGGIGSFLAACGGGSGGGSSNEVVVLGWADYVEPQIQALVKKAGLNMRPVPAETDQDMFTKVKAGGGGAYDIVFANCGFSPSYYKAGLVEAFDVQEVRSWQKLWPVFREDTNLPYVLEKNKVTLYPNMWDSYAMIWNKEASFQPAQPYSWNALWDAAVPKGKIIMKGGAEDLLAISGLSLGVPKDQVYAMSGKTLQDAAKHLADLKPYQIAPSDDVEVSAIRSKKAWIGQSTSLGLGPRVDRAAGKALAGVVVPKEGSIGWIDGPQLVKGAKNRENALKFMEIWTSQPVQDYIFHKSGFNLCNKAQTQRLLNGGGDDAKAIRDHGGDHPELATRILYQAPPTKPTEWAQAYDGIVGG